MNYGLIGEKLGHSWSVPLHRLIGGYDYLLCELAPRELDGFFAEKNFCGINVTIPYKKAVMKYLDFIDASAEKTGAVNTIINRGGKLFGYNTDYFGLKVCLGGKISGKTVLIFGTGGTARTAGTVCGDIGAAETIFVSRSPKNDEISYSKAAEKYGGREVFLINATPCGMYPDTDGEICNISKFRRVVGAFDAIYNPLRTRFVLLCKERGISCTGGLYMLAAQGVRSSELFFDTEYPSGKIDEVYEKLLREKENIVLIGMPTSTKSTVGRILSERMGRVLFDCDAEVELSEKISAGEYIERHGEECFRKKESEILSYAAKENGKIIVTGGGAVTKRENIERLRQNGRIFFLDRPLSLLSAGGGRPLSSTPEKLSALYEKRYPLYLSFCDTKIDASGDALQTAEKIIAEWEKKR